jgi:hypothetical protein
MSAFDYADVEYAEATYHPDEDRTLSEAVLETIERFKGEDLRMAEFVLFNSINPDAVDQLFYHDAQSDVVLEFDVDDVRVFLWGDGGVEIRVTEQAQDIFA